MLRLGGERRKQAERAGYRVGSTVGRWIAQATADSAGLKSRRSAGTGSATASRMPAHRAGAPRVGHGRPGATTVAVLGLGLELPITRPLLHRLLGVLRAELFMSGATIASLLTIGNPRDPLQCTSALVSLASPLIRLAARQVLGPLPAELMLTAVGIGLLALIRARQRPINNLAGAKPISVGRSKPSVAPALPRRLIAAG